MVDHPRRGHPGGGAGARERGAAIREGRRGDAQATIGRGGVQRPDIRGEKEHPAIRAAEDVRNFENGVTRIGTIELNGARTPETHGKGADFFVRILVVRTVEAEGATIQRETDRIGPAPLIPCPGEETGVGAVIVIVEENQSLIAQANGIGRGTRGGIDQRTLIAANIQCSAVADFKRARAQRRRTTSGGRGPTDFENQITTPVNERTTGVIIRVLDDDRTVRIRRRGVAARVGTDRRTDFDRGTGAGERVVDARESERATRAEAVAITRARCEGTEELRAVAQLEGIAAEELVTVADGAHVERAHEVRDTDLQGAAEGRGHRRGGELAGVRGEIILQHQHAEVIHRAQHGDAGDAPDTAHTRETQEAVRIDNDGSRTERRAGGGRDLQEAAADDIRTAGEGIRIAANAEHARTGLIDGESVGARHVLDHPGEVDDGTTGAAGARGDIDQRRIATGDRARETEVQRVYTRRGGERRITQGEVTELEIAI